VLRGKVSPKGALLGHKIPSADLKAVKRIFDKIESRPERIELNLYISGDDKDNEVAPIAEGNPA
jgi:succinate dehydrogenase iron-sulfur subunit